MKPRTKTAREVRAELHNKGISIAQWARDNQVSYDLTHQVLAGRAKGNYGQSHRIAVLLGMKAGEALAKSATASRSRPNA